MVSPFEQQTKPSTVEETPTPKKVYRKTAIYNTIRSRSLSE